MTHDSTSLLMGFGRDVARVFGQAPSALCRIDEHGWVGLTGETGAADMNMVAVTRSASTSLVEEYIGEIRDRGVEGILIVEEDAPDLDAAAEGLGMPKVGTIPVMVWKGHPAPIADNRYKVRMGSEADIPAANALIAGAFSVDEEKVQRARPPSVVRSGADLWLVEDEDEDEAIGTGMFVHRGDHVGVYCMATPERHQRRGVGRAVLDAAMAYYLERGAKTFTLEATAAGLHLYEQVGFVTAATPTVYVAGPRRTPL